MLVGQPGTGDDGAGAFERRLCDHGDPVGGEGGDLLALIWPDRLGPGGDDLTLVRQAAGRRAARAAEAGDEEGPRGKRGPRPRGEERQSSSGDSGAVEACGPGAGPGMHESHWAAAWTFMMHASH